MPRPTVAAAAYAALLLALVAAPPLIVLTDQPFVLDLLTRVVILALAVAALNLITGYGGMVSLGHAAYLGIGAYSVAIPAYYGIYDGAVHLALAIGCSALFALITGAICLRTRGVYFIMITLAFAQMLYFTFVSIAEYGADDGLVIEARSRFPGLDLASDTTLYYCALGVLLLWLYAMRRITRARFGRVLAGAMHNERRMQSLGFPTYRHRLIGYVLSGTVCGVAGMLLGNFTGFISPAMMDWTRSAELIFMLMIGGIGALIGPLTGTALFVLLEEWLSSLTVYWSIPFGLLLIALVLFGHGGLDRLLRRIAPPR